MITPLFNNIQITIEKETTKTATSSGIILLEKESEKLERSTVLAVGPDTCRIQVGDVVLYKSYSSDTMTIDGQDVAFIKEEDILATYVPDVVID